MFGPHSKPISACFGQFWLPADTTRFWPNWHELELSQRESVEKKKKNQTWHWHVGSSVVVSDAGAAPILPLPCIIDGLFFLGLVGWSIYTQPHPIIFSPKPTFSPKPFQLKNKKKKKKKEHLFLMAFVDWLGSYTRNIRIEIKMWAFGCFETLIGDKCPMDLTK